MDRIVEWSKELQSLAQAGLYYHFGIPKVTLPEKMFGVFEHKCDRKKSILMRGFCYGK